MNKKCVLHIIIVRHNLILTFVSVRKNGVYFRVGSKESRIELAQAQCGVRRGFYSIWGFACSSNAGPRPFGWGIAICSSGNVKPAAAFSGSFCRTTTADPFDFSQAGCEKGAKKV